MARKPTPTEVVDIPKDREAVETLVNELLRIDSDMAHLAARRRVIETQLEAWALKHGKAVPLAEAEREGKRVLAPAGGGLCLPIVFTSDELIGSFQIDSAKHKELLGLLSAIAPEEMTGEDLLKLFFRQPHKMERIQKDGHKFRRLVFEVLPKTDAPKFIAACRAVDADGIPKSKTVVDTDHLILEEGTAE